MRLDEQEIPSVSDKSPITQKQHRINRKKGVEGLLNDIPEISLDYQPVSVNQRKAKSLAPPKTTPVQLFRLFITPRHCRLIAKHTNHKAQDLRGKNKHTRPWHDTTASEIDVFLGALLFMGLDRLNCVKDYWTQRDDKSITMPIQNALSQNRFEQIKRFLKLNDGRAEPPGLGKGPDWWKKLEPLATDIRKASVKYYQSSSQISIDEQLVGFNGRSRHTMTIHSKTEDIGYKIYSSVDDGNYLLDFLFASKATKISQLKTARKLGLDPKLKYSDSALLVVQLCKAVPTPNFIVFMDNFFCSIKLFKALRSLNIAACGTAKKGSGFPAELLAFRDVASKKNDWGLRSHMTVEDVLCMSWVDNNSVQLMTTAHSIDDVSKHRHYLDVRKRHGIPDQSASSIYLPSIAAHSNQLPVALPVPIPIRDYNLHMGGSDGNAQQRAYYSINRRNDKYWWPLFSFLIDAAALNAYKLYLLDDSDSDSTDKLSRSEFIRHIATSLLHIPTGNMRKHQPQLTVHTDVPSLVSPPKHHYIHMEKRLRCHPCAVNNIEAHGVKRGSLDEIDVNRRKKRKRGSQTRWACGGCEPITACCKKADCWEAIHMGMKDVEGVEEEVENNEDAISE